MNNQQLIDLAQDWRKKTFLIGLAGSALSIAGLVVSRQAFAASYLVSFLFWLGITIGSFPILFLHYLTGGNWGYPIRRILEMMTRQVLLMFLFFIPVLLLVETLYPWAQPEVIAHDALLQAKQVYLNASAFALRAVIYFLLWTGLALLLNRWSIARDNDPSKSNAGRLQFLGGLGLVLYGLTATFSSIDWGMSLEPHWYSTIYGFRFMIDQTLVAFCFSILLVLLWRDHEPFTKILNKPRAHDLGTFLFAFIMIWAYISLSQFIIIWSGNLKEEAPYYLKRFQNEWGPVAVLIVLFHFVIPFFLLLMRQLKRNYRFLSIIVLAILMLRWIDLIWLIKPAFEKKQSFHLLDLTTMFGLGGLWIAVLLTQVQRSRLRLKQDPVFLEDASHGE